jgi:hypothetical protein
VEREAGDAADIRSRLWSAGERLGWQFRDRHHFWRHWPQPAPDRSQGQTRLLRDAMTVWMVGLWLGGGVLAFATLGVWAFSLVRPTSDWPGVMAGWLVFAGALVVYVILTRRVPVRRHAALVARWERERDAYNATERGRVDDLDEWGAVRTLPGTRRIDVFGGEHQGWAAFLTTFGTSALAEGTPLIVLDLSGVDVSAELCDVSEQAGVDARVEHLPDEMGASALLAGLSPTDVKDVLVEAIHGERSELGRDDRVLDDRILTAVCEALRPNPTLPRVHEALRRLLREPGLAPAHLGEADVARVDALFAEAHLDRVQERVQRLEAYLAHLAQFATGSAASTSPARLTCFSITQRGSQLTTDLVVDLLGQWLIRSLKNVGPGQSPRTIVVAGADQLKTRHLERVSTLCDSLGFRLVLLFQHLRDSGSALLGGGRATVFMRLGNYEEAERAANFIGRGHRFELSRMTTEHGGSDTRSRETSHGGEVLRPWTRIWGSSRSRAMATSWNHAEMSQRVHEYHVEPAHLQALPPTAFVLVQHVADQRVLTVAADCNPDILSLPRVSTEPLADPRSAPPAALPAHREALPRHTT